MTTDLLRTQRLQSDVLEAPNGLDLDSLRALIERKALILRVPRFATPELCQALARKIQKVGYDDYLNAPSVGRIGMSFFETGGKDEMIDHYFDTALDNIRILRNGCAPYLSPIDVMRCVLDEVWPAGAHIQSLSGRKMFVGLSRNMRPGAPLLAHHDMFSRLAPNDVEANDLVHQFAANVYVDMPEEGGELLMWKNEISDAEFLERRGDKYAMELDTLGEADIVVKPQVGDLILFNARKLHAVAAGSGRDRLTFSSFVGYRSADRPLTFWS
jgi:hypothetical protein